MKNILIFEDSSKAKFGGGQKVTLEVIKSLKDEYNIFLFDCKKNSLFKEKALLFTKKIFELLCYGKIKKSEKSSFSVGIFEIILFPLIYILNVIRIIWIIKIHKFNKDNTLVYAATKKSLLYAFVLKKILGIEYIFHSHAYDDKNSLFYKLLLPAYKNAKKIICVSNFVKDNFPFDNTVVVYNPVSVVEGKIKNIRRKNKIVVGAFSTLIKLKGLDYFMKSYKFLKNKDKVMFWVFGEGEERDNLRKYENKNVILKGFSNNVEKVLSKDIDILILPSVSFEACPMVILEAFKYGIPVITTNIGGQCEIVKDGYNGILVPPKNEKYIAKTINFLIENPKIYERLSKNALEYIRKFDKNEFKQKIKEIFDENITAW